MVGVPVPMALPTGVGESILGSNPPAVGVSEGNCTAGTVGELGGISVSSGVASPISGVVVSVGNTGSKVGVLVGTSVSAGAKVAVGRIIVVEVAVAVAVLVGVNVGWKVGVRLGVLVAVCVLVLVGVRVTVGVKVTVKVRVTVGVAVWVGVRVGVKVTVGVEVGSGVSVLVIVRVGGTGVGVNDADCVINGNGVLTLVGTAVGVWVGVLVRVAVCDRTTTITRCVAVGRGVREGLAVGLRVGDALFPPAPAKGSDPPLAMIESARIIPRAIKAPARIPTRIERLPFPGVAPAEADPAPAGGWMGGIPVTIADMTRVGAGPTGASTSVVEPLAGADGVMTEGGTGGRAADSKGEEAMRVRPPAWPITPRSAWASDAASAKRSAGLFASKRKTIVSRAGGMARLYWRGNGGAFCTCCIATAIGFSASNGKRPVSISNNVTPSA
jgi:hypothetical protein